MGITEEPTAASAEQSAQSVHDVILDMLDKDPALDATVKDDALAEVVGKAQDNRETRSAPTLFTSGFRGMGRQARLDWHGLLL